jgi:hypothetical protein
MVLRSSASSRNECQESSWGVKGCRRVRLENLPPSVNRLSRENVGTSTSHNAMGVHGLLTGIALTFHLYLVPVSVVISTERLEGKLS